MIWPLRIKIGSNMNKYKYDNEKGRAKQRTYPYLAELEWRGTA